MTLKVHRFDRMPRVPDAVLYAMGVIRVCLFPASCWCETESCSTKPKRGAPGKAEAAPATAARIILPGSKIPQ